MKVLLYFENEKAIRKSGIGRALQHQKKALELNGIEYTTNPKDSYDIAHVNTYYPNSTRLVKKCIKKGIPVVVHGHSTKEDFRNSFKCWRLLQPFVYWMLKRTYSKPDLIITPTPYSKSLIENYNYVKCPVINISNGIDLDRYAKVCVSKEEELEIRNKFNLGNSKIVMGIGWMFERKGVHDFIEVAKSMPDVKFIWFGQLNKMMNTRTINKAIKNKPDNVILPGYVEQQYIIKMLHIANIFMFPSYEETEGIVLLEALACKIPVLVRDVGSFNYLTDSVDVFKGNNNQQFIEKINYILNNDCNNVVENGFNVADDRELSKIGLKLIDAYQYAIKLSKERKK